MLAALLAGYLLFSFGGGFAAELFGKEKEALVREVVSDPGRADAAVRSIKQGRDDVEASGKRFAAIAKDFSDTDELQSAGLDQLTPFLQQSLEQRRIVQQASLDRVFELRATLTEAEWNTAFGKLK